MSAKPSRRSVLPSQATEEENINFCKLPKELEGVPRPTTGERHATFSQHIEHVATTKTPQATLGFLIAWVQFVDTILEEAINRGFKNEEFATLLLDRSPCHVLDDMMLSGKLSSKEIHQLRPLHELYYKTVVGAHWERKIGVHYVESEFQPVEFIKHTATLTRVFNHDSTMRKDPAPAATEERIHDQWYISTLLGKLPSLIWVQSEHNDPSKAPL
ncbi:hypothetical protein G7Y89_g8581 [Cudoniella acicularis]|uniref:Uncharacterized protein n=1 Tax=Cudoniella acicularis TaxID=354080 RepID=A0A8H4RGB2_9HELO|nr:hypothetical protein G7Y89_g8581 [Cudoniella acicularis]